MKNENETTRKLNRVKRVGEQILNWREKRGREGGEEGRERETRRGREERIITLSFSVKTCAWRKICY
jgi:hypothetical protein